MRTGLGRHIGSVGKKAVDFRLSACGPKPNSAAAVDFDC